MHVNWHAHFKIWHVVWRVKEKNDMPVDTLEIEGTCTNKKLN